MILVDLMNKHTEAASYKFNTFKVLPNSNHIQVKRKRVVDQVFAVVDVSAELLAQPALRRGVICLDSKD